MYIIKELSESSDTSCMGGIREEVMDEIRHTPEWKEIYQGVKRKHREGVRRL